MGLWTRRTASGAQDHIGQCPQVDSTAVEIPVAIETVGVRAGGVYFDGMDGRLLRYATGIVMHGSRI